VIREGRTGVAKGEALVAAVVSACGRSLLEHTLAVQSVRLLLTGARLRHLERNKKDDKLHLELIQKTKPSEAKLHR
jgi:hypothetical protein